MNSGGSKAQAAAVIALTLAVLGLAGYVYVDFQRGVDQATEGPARPLPPRPSESARPALPKLQLPADPKVMVIGDSWSTGYAAGPGRGYLALVAKRFGWDDVQQIPNAPSSGWMWAGPDGRAGTFEDRLKKQPRDPEVDLMFMHGGLNDQQVVRDGKPLGERFNNTVDRTIKLVRKKYPTAQIVVMGPVMPVPGYSGIIPEIDSRLAFQAPLSRYHYISPLTDGWFGSDEAIRRFINEDATDHPNNQGHAEYAKRLTAALRELGLRPA